MGDGTTDDLKGRTKEAAGDLTDDQSLKNEGKVDRATGSVSYGRVPAGSVVVAGSLPSVDGSCHLYCAVIVKRVDARTRAKTSINELLRA